MKLPRHTLAMAIAERTMDVRDEHRLAQEIAAYLLAEKRTGELESILRDIMQYRANQGALEAEVVTAHEIDSHVLAEVKDLLKHAYPQVKSVQVGVRQDSSVIGGVRIDMPNEQLDMTVKNKLATFKRLTAGDNT